MNNWLQNIKGQITELATEVLNDATEEGQVSTTSELQIEKKKSIECERLYLIEKSQREALEKKLVELEEQLYCTSIESDAVKEKFEGMVFDRDEIIKRLERDMENYKFLQEHNQQDGSFQNIELNADLSTNEGESTSYQITKLKEKHEHEISAILAAHSSNVKQLKDDYERKIEQLEAWNTLNSSGSTTENYEQLLTNFNKLKDENDVKNAEILDLNTQLEAQNVQIIQYKENLIKINEENKEEYLKLKEEIQKLKNLNVELIDSNEANLKEKLLKIQEEHLNEIEEIKQERDQLRQQIEEIINEECTRRSEKLIITGSEEFKPSSDSESAGSNNADWEKMGKEEIEVEGVSSSTTTTTTSETKDMSNIKFIKKKNEKKKMELIEQSIQTEDVYFNNNEDYKIKINQLEDEINLLNLKIVEYEDEKGQILFNKENELNKLKNEFDLLKNEQVENEKQFNLKLENILEEKESINLELFQLIEDNELIKKQNEEILKDFEDEKRRKKEELLNKDEELIKLKEEFNLLKKDGDDNNEKQQINLKLSKLLEDKEKLIQDYEALKIQNYEVIEALKKENEEKMKEFLENIEEERKENSKVLTNISTLTNENVQLKSLLESKHEECQKYYLKLEEFSKKIEFNLIEISKKEDDLQVKNGKINKLESELNRLKEHLLNIEEMSSKEAIAAEERETDLRRQLREYKDKFENDETLTTKSLKNYKSELEQLKINFSILEDEKINLTTILNEKENLLAENKNSLLNLQIVLKDIADEQKNEKTRFAAEIKLLKEELKKEKLIIKEFQLKEETIKLTQNTNEDKLKNLENLLKIKNDLIDELENNLEEFRILKNNEEDNSLIKQQATTTNIKKIDDSTLKQLFLSFFMADKSKQPEIALVMAKILGYSLQEQAQLQKAINSSSSSSSWFSFGGSSTQPFARKEVSLTEQFIRFLEQESVDNTRSMLALPSIESSNTNRGFLLDDSTTSAVRSSSSSDLKSILDS